ncbi:phosphoribosylaminoimidazolecarboxamide formyltransferase [Poriferisphaera sp. WC338]|uniref:phosphoribosylaminoimidazolecarboxamide formyltransferase n=1 Tax=Poriferisphaera sp. WC338 TaxID=3425129 RepID=UPI003D814CA5
MEIKLKYGCNPNQSHARVVYDGEGDCPLAVVNGAPSYINLLDGLRGWQLVRDLKAATGKAAAASYKHVSPAGAAVAGELSESFCKAHFYKYGEDYSPVATAYAKARSSDRVASFGDFIAVSEVVDESLAMLIKPEVSDGIIAPGYEAGALEILKGKKGGKYVMLQMDAGFVPPAVEGHNQFGLRLEQSHNDVAITAETITNNVVTKNKDLSAGAIETALVATITLKHTQSNSISVGVDGQAIGIGAGQQSRIGCTRLACEKADRWLLKQHPKALVLEYKDVPKSEKVNALDGYVRWHELNDSERADVQKALVNDVDPLTAGERADWFANNTGELVYSSDAFIPFRDNLDRAAASGVKFIVQTGGSARDEVVIKAADEHGMAMSQTGIRLFLH